MIGNARQPIPHALITKACPFECNRLIERKKTQLSDICSGKCGGNVSALCLHKANKGYMSHQRGNYDFHLEHIKYIFLNLSRRGRSAERGEMQLQCNCGKGKKLLSICCLVKCRWLNGRSEPLRLRYCGRFSANARMERRRTATI